MTRFAYVITAIDRSHANRLAQNCGKAHSLFLELEIVIAGGDNDRNVQFPKLAHKAASTAFIKGRVVGEIGFVSERNTDDRNIEGHVVVEDPVQCLIHGVKRAAAVVPQDL